MKKINEGLDYFYGSYKITKPEYTSSDEVKGKNSYKLIRAAKDGDVDTIKEELEKGATPDSSDDIIEKYWEYAEPGNRASYYVHFTALAYAIDGGHIEAIKILLDAGANPIRYCSVNGGGDVTTPLEIAKQVGGGIYDIVLKYAQPFIEKCQEKENFKKQKKQVQELFKGTYYYYCLPEEPSRLEYEIKDIGRGVKLIKSVEEDKVPYEASVYVRVNKNIPYLRPDSPRVRKVVLRYDPTHADEDNALVFVTFYNKGIDEIKRTIVVMEKLVQTRKEYPKVYEYMIKQSYKNNVVDFLKNLDEYYKQALDNLQAVEYLENLSQKANAVLW